MGAPVRKIEMKGQRPEHNEKRSKKITTPTMKTEIFQFTWSRTVGFDINFNIDPKGLRFEDCRALEKNLKRQLRLMLKNDERVKDSFLVVVDANWDCEKSQYYHTKKKTVNVQMFVHTTKVYRTWKEYAQWGREFLRTIEATILQVVLDQGVIIQQQLRLCS